MYPILLFLSPVPDITWFRNGIEITTNDSSFVIKPNKPGELIIPKFTRNLEGNYKCSLSNKRGRVESDGEVILAGKTKNIVLFSICCQSFGLPAIPPANSRWSN